MAASPTTRYLTEADATALHDLYKAIASRAGGFVRTEDEISIDYATRTLSRAVRGGVAIGAFENGHLIGSITARNLGLKAFSHVLSSVTIGVHPDEQSQGIGRRLFIEFLEHVQMERPDILRVELIARDSNTRQISFYESIGFRREGTFEKRIRTPNGEFEADIPMAWLKRD